MSTVTMKNHIRHRLRQTCAIYRPANPGGMAGGSTTALGSHVSCRTMAVKPSERHEAHQRFGEPLADLEAHFVDLPATLDYFDRIIFTDAPGKTYEVCGLDEVRGPDGLVCYTKVVLRQIDGSGAGGVLG